MQYLPYQTRPQAVKCKLTGTMWGCSLFPGTLLPERGYQMADTSTISTEDTETKSPVTLDSLQESLNAIGEQMNWLCDNLMGLFGFVNQLGANGGGIRGMMKAMKDMPEMIQSGNGETGE